MRADTVRRLNWGCGERAEPGWVNSDLKEGDGIVTADIRRGLPFKANWFDYIVSVHALPELAYSDLLPALRELHRIVKRGGTVRLALPDLEKGIEAYQRGDRSYFQIPDDEMQTLGGKLVVQLVWYGYSRTIFVPDFVDELLFKAGFCAVDRVEFGETRSGYPDIASLDNRRLESFFVEGRK